MALLVLAPAQRTTQIINRKAELTMLKDAACAPDDNKTRVIIIISEGVWAKPEYLKRCSKSPGTLITIMDPKIWTQKNGKNVL